MNSDSLASTGSASGNDTSRLWRWIWFVLATAVIAIPLGFKMGDLFLQRDAPWYVMIAEGNTKEVLQPFASRQLGPLLVRAMSAIAHIDIYRSFILQGTFSILVILCCVGSLLMKKNASWWMLTAVGGLAFWARLYQGLALPDLWFSALLSVFLWLLYRERFFASGLLLLPMQVSREATILALICFLIAGGKRLRVQHWVTAIAATFIGTRIVGSLTAGGASNQQGVSPLLYLLGKVPWNFMKNVLGFPLWNNLYQACSPPLWSTSVHIGGMSTVGVCPFLPGYPLATFRWALTTFGLFPLLAFFCWRKKLFSLWPQNIMLRFCVSYAGVSFLLAPSLGATVLRLFGYGWPLFLLAFPMLIGRQLDMKRLHAGLFLAIHLIISWSSTLLDFSSFRNSGSIWMLFPYLVAYGLAWMLLRQTAEISPESYADRTGGDLGGLSR